MGRHVAPLWHIILILNQPVFALISECWMLSRETKNNQKTTIYYIRVVCMKDMPQCGSCYPLSCLEISTFNFQQFVMRIEEHFMDWPWSFIYRLGSMKFVIFEENCFVHFLQVSYFKTMSCFDCTIDTNFVKKKNDNTITFLISHLHQDHKILF